MIEDKAQAEKFDLHSHDEDSGKSCDVPISSGEMKVEATVTLIYEIAHN